jgi:hypothetical protein
MDGPPSGFEVIDELIDAQPVVDDFIPDNLHVDALINDLANDIYAKSTIAARYGMTMAGLLRLARIEVFAKAVKQRKALVQSDAGALERVPQLAAASVLHYLDAMSKRIMDPAIPQGLQFEYWKHLNKIAGFENMAKQQPNGPPIGAQFAVNIFLGQEPERMVATTVVNMPTIDATLEPIPGLA